jgi:hypothetical protein
MVALTVTGDSADNLDLYLTLIHSSHQGCFGRMNEFIHNTKNIAILSQYETVLKNPKKCYMRTSHSKTKLQGNVTLEPKWSP